MQTPSTSLSAVAQKERHASHYGRPIWNRAGQYIFALPFLLQSSSSIFLVSSPYLSRRRLDVCHTSPHDVALVRIYDAGLKRAERGSLKIQDAKSRQKSPSGHHRTNLWGYVLQLRHVSTIEKKTF